MCSWGLTEGRSLREAARRNTGAHLFFPSCRSPPPRSPVNLFCETQPCLTGSLTPPLSPEMGSVMQAGSYLQGGRKRSAEDEAVSLRWNHEVNKHWTLVGCDIRASEKQIPIYVNLSCFPSPTELFFFFLFFLCYLSFLLLFWPISYM